MSHWIEKNRIGQSSRCGCSRWNRKIHFNSSTDCLRQLLIFLLSECENSFDVLSSYSVWRFATKQGCALRKQIRKCRWMCECVQPSLDHEFNETWATYNGVYVQKIREVHIMIYATLNHCIANMQSSEGVSLRVQWFLCMIFVRSVPTRERTYVRWLIGISQPTPNAKWMNKHWEFMFWLRFDSHYLFLWFFVIIDALAMAWTKFCFINSKSLDTIWIQ